MVGYEILTRKQVYQSSELPPEIIMYFIEHKNLKPDTAEFDKIEKLLENQDLCIFSTIKELVVKCWQHNPLNRPNISEGIGL